MPEAIRSRPEPEKPKRQKILHGGHYHLQVLPGDPPDLDALLDVVDSAIEARRDGRGIDFVVFMEALEAARQGEGGEG